LNHRLNHGRAFTVLELVIVISVILVLMALALTVTSTVLAANDRRTMQNTFLMLDQAIVSWEAQAGRPLSFGRRLPTHPPPAPAPVPPDPDVPDFTIAGTGPSAAFDIYEEVVGALPFPTAYAICVVLDRLAKSPDSAEIISRIPNTSIRMVQLVGTNTVEPLPIGWPSTAAGIDPNQMPAYALVREIFDPWGRRIAVNFPGRAATKAEIAEFQEHIDAEDGTVHTRDEFSMGVCRNRKICFVSAGPDGDFGTLADNIYSYELLPRPTP